MSRRYPARVLVLWTLAGLLVVAAVALFGYGRFGGTSPDDADPYRWRPPEPLVISHHAGLTDTSWCQVRPATGEHHTFRVTRRSSGSLRIQVERAWFDGEAEVACHRAKLLTGPVGPYVDQWFTAGFLALIVLAISAPVLRRYRRRHPATADPGPGAGGSATAAGGQSSPGSVVPATAPAADSAALVVDAYTSVSGRGLLAGLSKPTIVVDGRAHTGRWGRTELPLPPGRHGVEVWVPGRLPRRGGLAGTEVTVAPGEKVQVEFRAPLWRFLPGSLGPPPQHHRGAWLTFVLVGVAAAAFCAVLTWAGLTGG